MFTAFYLRVSTADQSVENQALELKAAGFEPTATFTDDGVSGKTKAADREAFAEMMRTFGRINSGERKRLIVTKIDRLGRDAEDILATVRLLSERGVQVFVKQLGETDLTSTAGKMILTVLGGVAEMERAMIVERTHAGLARARASGKTLGRPAALTNEKRAEVRDALDNGASVNGLAKRYGVARGTIRSAKVASR
ncbi:MAG: recombinase family protein [Vitreimonas sp.]